MWLDPGTQICLYPWSAHGAIRKLGNSAIFKIFSQNDILHKLKGFALALWPRVIHYAKQYNHLRSKAKEQVVSV